ncbi:C-5 cytosine-specific DNA methylase [Physocladia obscura]|uniref:C-5 cytosine-specific DNA methylase n=1 Tax=Physocladia obscura TaxID=109957 RepID=A0AAD5XEM0_9FUNG|nr:C-5 cytosine-specific DNA methylase [Physocladia obscura]
MFSSILELYSGLGGHRSAYTQLMNLQINRLLDGEENYFNLETVFHSFDVNENANLAYEHNFGQRSSTKDISKITAADLEAIKPQLLVMSPPCQPYTRNGTRLESKDTRSNSFISFLAQLSAMSSDLQPTHILLENVLGFENSDTFTILCETLTSNKYTVQSYIINPNQCGIPNSRPRFYLLAKKTQVVGDFAIAENNNRHNFPPIVGMAHALTVGALPSCISEYIDNTANSDAALLVSHRKLWKAGAQFDILRPTHMRSCCFTKGYSQHARGTGSVLCMASDAEILAAAIKFGFNEDDDSCVQKATKCRIAQVNWEGGQVASESVLRAMKWLFVQYFEMKEQFKPLDLNNLDENANLCAVAKNGEKMAKQTKRLSARKRRELDMERGSWPDKMPKCPLDALRLRYFSVKEVAWLQGFPEWYSFPETLTQEQGWKLLGNSINVKIVMGLLEYLQKDGVPTAISDSRLFGVYCSYFICLAALKVLH